jgi:hypothetical protein
MGQVGFFALFEPFDLMRFSGQNHIFNKNKSGV